jgi:hypothetical protein
VFFFAIDVNDYLNGNLAEWHERRTSTLRIAIRVIKTPTGARRCFLEKETLHSLFSTGLIRERNRECVYKLPIQSNYYKF